MKRIFISLIGGLLFLNNPTFSQTDNTEEDQRAIVLQRTDDRVLFYKVYSGQTGMQLDATDVQELVLETGAGKLEIVPSSSQEVEVEAIVTVSGGNVEKAYRVMDEYLDLSMDRSGSKMRIVSKFDFEERRNNNRVVQSGGFFRSPYRKVDLYVRVPAGIAVKVVDGSGDIFVNNIENDLRIDDGSGSISVKNVEGHVDINDNSGELYLNSINESGKHSVRINDNSGGIVARKLGGEVFVRDASGGLEIRGVNGSLSIHDTSGGVVVRNVTGDLSIDDTSGGIDSRDIGGFVTLDDRSGGIHVDNVGEGVYVAHNGSGQLSIRNNRGNLRGDIRKLNR